MSKIGWIAFGIVLVALVLSQGQAKDYVERIGPYEASFKLPDDIASTIEVNKTTTSSETLSGVPYDTYILDLSTSGIDLTYGWLSINHYDMPYEIDLSKTAENVMGSFKGAGYTCSSAQRKIDGHEGYVVNFFGSERYTSGYQFGYQLDNQTIVGGTLYLDWDTAVLPLLKSLHVEVVP